MDTNTYRLPTHPGDVQKEELEVRGITQKRFSEYAGIPYTLLNEILNAKRPVTSDIALVIEADFGINPEMLIHMQSHYNMAQALLRPDV
ncbi:MAG: HigA family addiction module antitoxin [Phocaeicola plebeius]